MLMRLVGKLGFIFLTLVGVNAMAEKPSISVTADTFPAIPEMVTSFGAAATDNAVYLYGGHTGRAHQYCSEAQANTL
ncbi:MAG: hypothetical protein P8L85_02230, partial [Rubripirellula sp.]|nr:hypothetical protein [Rubripirellula sp.]